MHARHLIKTLQSLMAAVVLAACGGGGVAGAAPLPAPTSLQATAGNAQVTLSWNASPGAASYSVYQGSASNLELPLPVQTGISGTSTRITGLSNGSRYFFKITAVSGTRSSAFSNEASATPVAGTAPPPAGNAGTLALTASAYSVAQNAGTLTVTVTRSGGSSGAVSVGYGTANGSASAGSDYTATSGVVNWPAGDATVKTFSVPISNGRPYTGSKTFTVAIASPGGGATLGTPNNALVTINGSQINTGAMGKAAAARLLAQGTFGATTSSINTAANQTYDQWFNEQAQATPSLTYPYIKDAKENTNWVPYWWQNTVTGPDQLRQRMAWALSQILVISGQSSALFANNNAQAFYYDLLTQNAFGTYRQLLEKTTLSLQMGVFLNMYHSDKPDAATGIHADQNYAREIMQLFTIGLVELNLDGTPKLDSNGRQIPTYGYAQIEALANTFTGWASNPTTQTGENAYRYDYDFTRPMVGYENHHDTSAKTIVGGTPVPANGTTAGDLKIALDALVNHANTAPFISKALIQRLITSNPSPAYVQRVATVFKNSGGDLLMVAKAILTDTEAVNAGGSTDGKLREPLLKLTGLWRAFSAADSTGKVNDYGITQNAYAISGQSPLGAATVFNFYAPDYVRAGRLANAKLVVPEFQISNENTLALTDSEYLRLSYQFEDGTGKKRIGYQNFDETQNLRSDTVLLHTAAWESLASDPAGLIDQMNLVLMQGLMPSAMRTTLINYVSGIPSSDDVYLARRVVEAANLIINSPQFAVQR